MNTLYHRRDLFEANDKKYLKWFAYEAGVSAALHCIAMVTIMVLWYTSWNNLHQTFTHLNDCAVESLKNKLPYICFVVACMAILHFILTLIYVKYLPHVWSLDPRSRNLRRRYTKRVSTSKSIPLRAMTNNQTIMLATIGVEENLVECNGGVRGGVAFTAHKETNI